MGHGRQIAIFVCIAVVGALSGCGTTPPRQVRLCPGKMCVADSIAALQGHRDNAKPVRAGGTIVFTEYEDREKISSERIDDVTIRFLPPHKLFLRANFIGGEAIRLGTNEQEFYLRIKPDQVSKYWYGDRAKLESCSQRLLINPEGLLEALGIVSLDCADFDLSNDGRFDILTGRTSSGQVVKRIYIDCCDYLAARIEYFDVDGSVLAVLELKDYTKRSDGITVPTGIRAQSYIAGELAFSADITLKNISLFQPTEAQLKKLFERPGTEGFKDVYRLGDDCRFILQEL